MPREKASPEQRDLAADLWRSGVPTALIVEAVNRLNGKHFTKPKQIQDLMTKRLGVERPPGWKSKVAAADHARRRGKVSIAKENKKPFGIPLWMLINYGMQLNVPLAKRTCVETVSRAAKRDDPTHPGYVIVDAKPRSFTLWDMSR